MSEQAWSMHVRKGLTAHFKVPDDATTATRNDATYQSQTAMEYLNDRLNSGWHPKDDVEHTIHISVSM